MGRVPAYQLIYQDLAAGIHDGTLRPGEALPSEAEIGRRYGVSCMTVRQALGQLAREQLVLRQRGSRAKVCDHRNAGRRLNRLVSFYAELGVPAAAVETKILSRNVLIGPANVVERFDIDSDAEIACITRLRCVRNKPVALQESWLPHRLVPHLLREPLIAGSLYRTLQERWGFVLGYADQQISAALATTSQARLLQVKPRTALITAERLAYTEDGTLIEFSRSWATADYPVTVRLDRA